MEAKYRKTDPTVATKIAELKKQLGRDLTEAETLQAYGLAKAVPAGDETVKTTKYDANGQPLPFEGILAIQADKRVQYDTIRRIMYTAAASGYKTFRFLALKKEI